MWIIQGNHLMSIGDGARLPPASVRVELPADFLDDPRRYKVEYGKLVMRSDSEMQRIKARSDLKLTTDDIRRVKQAIERNVI
jgi:hypothetical protein